MIAAYSCSEGGMRLANKVAIITGAGRGLGRSGALLFAREGAQVVVVDYRIEPAQQVVDEIAAAGGQALAVNCDVTSSASVQQMVQAAIDRFGRIDVLWNNVGGVGWRPGGGTGPVSGNLLDTSEEDFDWMLALNLKSAFLVCKAVLPHMLTSGGGSIISSSSSPAILGNTPGQHAYVMAKAGVVAMGKLIASTWGRQGIRSNVVVPGLTDSHMNPALADWAAGVTAMGRIGGVDEVASVALFLASDDASYVSGETIMVDGGAAVWRGGGPPRMQGPTSD
jgi:NAD(P)-dependent dehydrogenase (short-subunit alcohol dehydrogenase family)